VERINELFFKARSMCILHGFGNYGIKGTILLNIFKKYIYSNFSAISWQEQVNFQ
jgi:hypothetical protein